MKQKASKANTSYTNDVKQKEKIQHELEKVNAEFEKVNFDENETKELSEKVESLESEGKI